MRIRPLLTLRHWSSPLRDLETFEAWIFRPGLAVALWGVGDSLGWPRDLRMPFVLMGIANPLVRLFAGKIPRAGAALPLANALLWAAVVLRAGSAQSLFVLGFFLEIGFAALRLSPAGCVAVACIGAAAVAASARRAGTGESAALGSVGAAAVLCTGAIWAIVVARARLAAQSARAGLHFESVAHGVKNCLHSVAGFAELLVTDLPADDPRRTLAQHIRHGLRDAEQHLAHGVRPGCRSSGVQAQSRMLAEVDRTLAACAGLLQAARVEARNDVDAGLTVCMAPEHLHRVLGNLIHNAVEAMPGGGKLVFRTTRPPVRLLVQDSGTGIAAAIRGRIFAPHFSTRGNGYGIGLAEARRLARDAGGDLELVETSAAGSVFALTLPVVESRQPESGLESRM